MQQCLLGSFVKTILLTLFAMQRKQDMQVLCTHMIWHWYNICSNSESKSDLTKTSHYFETSSREAADYFKILHNSRKVCLPHKGSTHLCPESDAECSCENAVIESFDHVDSSACFSVQGNNETDAQTTDAISIHSLTANNICSTQSIAAFFRKLMGYLAQHIKSRLASG